MVISLCAPTLCHLGEGRGLHNIFLRKQIIQGEQIHIFIIILLLPFSLEPWGSINKWIKVLQLRQRLKQRPLAAVPCDGNPNLSAIKGKQLVASEAKNEKQTDFEGEKLIMKWGVKEVSRGASWSSESSDLSVLVQADPKLWGFCLMCITSNQCG